MKPLDPESGEEIGDDLGRFDTGESLVEALGLETETFVIDAESVEDGGVKVADMDRIAGDVIAQFIGFTVG